MADDDKEKSRPKRRHMAASGEAGRALRAGKAGEVPRPPAPAAKGRRPSTKRGPDRAERRREILTAALDLFSEQGYAKTRLEDVARRAGVAKGTIYLYFNDKESLFEGIVGETIFPMLADADSFLSAFEGNTAALMDALMEMLVARVFESPAHLVIRLMLSEGPRFPRLCAFYHDEVVARGIAIIRKVARRAHARGEITSDAIERFPQLVVAPMLLAVVWNALFGALDPIDPRALLATHAQVLLRGLGGRAP